MGILRHFYISTIEKSPIYKTPPESFWKVIQETVEELSRRFPDWSRLIPAESLNKLIIAHCLIPLNEFNERFTHYKRIALKLPRDPSTLWKTISIGVLSPELEKAYLKSISLPSPDEYQTNPSTTPAPQKITPQATPTPKMKHPSKRGELWKSHRSEKKLWRSSKASFDHLLYRAQVPKDPDKFPWCQVSIKSLVKFTEYSHCQITRALAQLQRFKRIKRIVEGNSFQGASKYLVFFTLEMSRAHSYKSRHAKKD